MKQDITRVDRKRGPAISKITKLNIPPVSRELLSNGTELIEVNMGTQNLVQLEVLYRGGRISETKKGTARATARLIKEGTKTYSSSAIAEEVDFYGANISSGASLDYSYIKVFTLNKYFDKVLPILRDILNSPTFPESELEKFKANSIQKLRVEKTKSELTAYKIITECLYGEDHPYGYNSTEESYLQLRRQDLLNYYMPCYGTDNRIVILSGRITDDIRHAVRDMFGESPKHHVPIIYQEPQSLTRGISKKIKAEDDIQSAIKIGCRLFKRDHKDFADMFVLNTILGGYFGSRLMSSLREDKGYTYNIYSSVDMMIYDGYFNVSTEVGNEYLNQTLEGIYHEIEKLATKKVGSEELEMVRNYLSGNFLNMIDGPFKVAGMAKVVALNGLGFDFYSNLMHRIHTITPDDIFRVAKKYFVKENMVEIIVGNP